MANADLLSLERQEKIVQLVNDRGRLTVGELSDMFAVSDATIRRDLSALSDQRLIRRVHGGVMPSSSVATRETPIMQRQSQNADLKERIGAVTAARIADGDTLLLTGGSTGLAVARHLTGLRELTIVTESLLIVQELLRQRHANLILLGGAVSDEEQAVRGMLTRLMLSQLQVDKVIIGAKAISVERGLSAETLEEAELFRTCIAAGHQVIVATDASKFHQSALVQIAPFSAIHVLVTDHGLPELVAAQIQELGTQLYLA